jgi:hypothetical protein
MQIIVSHLQGRSLVQQAFEMAQGGPGSVKAPGFLDVRHYEGGRSSASRTGRLRLQEKSLVLIF